MKQSIYNILFCIDNKHYLYNTLSGTYVRISDHVYHCLETNDLNNIEDIGLQKLSKDLFLIEDNVDEYQVVYNQYMNKIYHSEEFHLTLLPTLDCNLRCWYCFEQHIEGSKMSESLKESLLIYIEQILNRKDIKNITFELFGGEPLLFFKDNVYPLLKRTKDLVDVHKKKIQLLIITNGILLTSENIELLREFDVFYQITIDGCRNKHNIVKKIKDKKDDSSYDLVMRNIANLSKEPNVHINLRINYDDHTLKHITEIISSIDTIDRSKIKIHLERVWQTLKSSNNDNVLLKNAIQKFIDKGFYVTYMNFFRKGFSCKASKINQCIISYDGKVFKCSGRNFSEDLQEGFLKEDGNIEWDKNKLDKRLSIITFDNDKCKKCKFLPLCYGPCCQKQLEMKEDKEKTIDSLCQLNHMEMSIEEYLAFRYKAHKNIT